MAPFGSLERNVTSALVSAIGIRKSFGATHAVAGVELGFAGGEVHALVGENGAGKSTLMRCLAGLAGSYDGEFRFDDGTVVPQHPAGALKVGIAMVQQELSLLPDLSAAENIFLGTRVGAGRIGTYVRREQEAAARALLADLGAAFDVRRHVRTLSIAERQLVEIGKALARTPRVLILDEPTSALTSVETAALLDLVKRLRERGLAVAYVSHRLDEVFEIADTITVLRDGRIVFSRPAAMTSIPEVVEGMVGRPVSEVFRPARSATDEVVLRVRGLSRPGEFSDVDLDLNAGEILGLAGLIGSGRSEIAETIFGLRQAAGGSIELLGEPFRVHGPGDAIARGVFLVSEDRARSGVIPLRSIRENVSLPFLRAWSRVGFIAQGVERQGALETIRAMDVRCQGPDQAIGHLSGGNQQRVLVGRWLHGRPRVLILDEPTRGIDIASKADIHALVRAQARAGVAVILISSELDEVIGASDRILVIRDGRVVADLATDGLTDTDVMWHASGARVEDAA
jgi:ABC-type sugar transport system ATPase subunit